MVVKIPALQPYCRLVVAPSQAEAEQQANVGFATLPVAISLLKQPEFQYSLLIVVTGAEALATARETVTSLRPDYAILVELDPTATTAGNNCSEPSTAPAQSSTL